MEEKNEAKNFDARIVELGIDLGEAQVKLCNTKISQFYNDFQQVHTLQGCY
jgi:hypothetical protein